MQLICSFCGMAFERASNYGRKGGYCSSTCKKLCRNKHSRESRAAEKAARGATCALPGCAKELTGRRTKFCSKKCTLIYRNRTASPFGFGDRSAVWIDPCPWCGVLVTRRFKRGPVLCCVCRIESKRSINAKKNLKRRAEGVLTHGPRDIELRDGNRCHICEKRIDMRLSGVDPNGPTIDHLVPVSKGGTNDLSNLALAHRKCNVARGNRGPAQLRLVA